MKATNETKTETWECSVCDKEVSSELHPGTGVCQSCDDKDIWIDPAGGVHFGDAPDYDPASMYE